MDRPDEQKKDRGKGSQQQPGQKRPADQPGQKRPSDKERHDYDTE